MTDTLPTATYLGPAQGYWIGDARLYVLATPTPSRNAKRVTDRVIVHAFPPADDGTPGDIVVLAAGQDGLLDTLTPLPGSRRRCGDHARALRTLGYEMARAA